MTAACTSPCRSEMLRWMESSILGSRSSAKRAGRRAGTGSNGGSSGGLFGRSPPGPGISVPPLAHHFERLVVPPSSKQHPLAGLWKGVYGPHGLEVLSVLYDFSAAAARIVATKVSAFVWSPSRLVAQV